MPTAHIVKRSRVLDSFRVSQVAGMFDLPAKREITHEWHAELPVEERTDWSVGLIVGPSGAGKSVLARELFPTAYFHESFDWPPEHSILDGFPEPLKTKDIIAALSSVGFSSPPHWLKRHAHLSNGQRFRCDLARCLLLDDPLVVFDEFTSVVDRDVARICSHAVAKAIRRRAKDNPAAPRFIALSCHDDIIEWLQPDWIYQVAAARFEWRRLCRRPSVTLHITRCSRDLWPLFRGHHYLSSALHRAAHCYLATWENKPVAFCAARHHVGLGTKAKGRRAFREHRIVVLPDYQGAGIGNAFSEFIADLHTSQRLRYYSTTGHPAFIHHRSRSPLWRLIRHPKQRSQRSGAGTSSASSAARLTASFEFIGVKPQASVSK